jgi:hypothetical protein
MASSTIFKNFSIPVEKKSLIIIANDIASDKYKPQVDRVRSLLTNGKSEEAQEVKKQILAFTPSAVFTEKRLMQFVEMYSGFIHLDFDKLTPEQLEAARKIIAEIPYTFLCFISPSGNGLKVFVEVTTGIEHHEIAYQQVQQYYEKTTGLKADPACKDITRLCFMSHDPQLIKNLQNKKFEVVLNKAPKTESNANSVKTLLPNQAVQQEVEDLNASFIFNQQIQFTNQKISYQNGNRNNYVYTLASNCNRAGLSQHVTCTLIAQHFDLPDREIQKAVTSAYSHHASEFAKFANVAKLQIDSEHNTEEYLKNTPAIPEELYCQMPEILKQGALAFTDARERDVFLTGALGILSGCIPNVKGIYAQQEVYPNLFTFAIAPAASGKGALKFAKQLADEYHTQLLTASKEADEQYKQEENAYKQNLRNLKKGETMSEEPPVKPAFKVVFIPANTSYAKILSHLEQNEGTGIICETEADTLGNVFKQEWGSYSDMLRKSFHHERLSSSRKTNNEFIEVNNPCLSIALSGTPSQVTGLIASAEDGLFSRFLFYAFEVEQIWKDVSPYGSNVNLTDHFRSLSLQVYNMVKFLKLSETNVTLSKSQWEQLNKQCAYWLQDITTFTSKDAASIVKRLGLILYRITMLFTALRKFENAEAAEQVECTDVDFNTALQLVEIYLQHSILMFNNLPKQQSNTAFQSGDGKRKFFDALPQEFTRAEAVALGKQHKLSARSVDDLLRNATPKLLTKIKAGHYQKP